MTAERKIARQRLSVFELAEKLGNVTEARRRGEWTAGLSLNNAGGSGRTG